MKKKIKIPIYTTSTEPDDYTPFSMVFGSVWKAYDAGEVSPDELVLFLNLYRGVNPHNGYGLTSYTDLCVRLKRKPSLQNINTVNKLMMGLRDVHHLLWFPGHSGSREFPYVLAKFKLAALDRKDNDKWVDIDPYFQSNDKSESRANDRIPTKLSPEPMPRQPPPEQRFERSNGEDMKSIKEDLNRRYGRPSQTDTDKET